MTSNEVLAVVAGPLALVGLIMPWIGHALNDTLFGVAVPRSFQSTPDALRAIGRYRRDCFLWALFLLALVYVCVRIAGDTPWVVLSLSASALPLELIGCFYLWHREHVRIAALRGKLALLDAEDHPGASQPDGLPTPDRPAGLLLVASAAFLPLIASALYLEAHFNNIPEHFPQHWNALGQVNGWAERTPATVFLPPMLGGAAVILVVASTVLLGLAPGTQARHRMRTLAPLAALAWLLSLIFSITSLLPFWGSLALDHMGPLVVALVLGSVAILLWLILRTAPGVNSLHPSDPTHWRAGIIYVNPQNPSLLVPKRFGWGWTLNFGQPLAWVGLLGLVLLGTAMVWLPRLLPASR